VYNKEVQSRKKQMSLLKAYLQFEVVWHKSLTLDATTIPSLLALATVGNTTQIYIILFVFRSSNCPFANIITIFRAYCLIKEQNAQASGMT